MSPYTTEAYRAFLRERLGRLTLAAISELREFLGRPRPNGTRRIEALLPARPLGERLAITLRLHGAEAGGRTVLVEWSPAWEPALTLEAQTEARRYHEAGVETLEIELQTVIEWFAACWKAAGGPVIGLPAHIGISNDLEALNLDTLVWESIPIPTPHPRRKTP